MLGECRYCNAPAPRLYTLPPRLRPELRAVGPACYFCFIRSSGIRPTRAQLASAAERDASTSPPRRSMRRSPPKTVTAPASRPRATGRSPASGRYVSDVTPSVMPLVISGPSGAPLDLMYEVEARRTTITAAPCPSLRRSRDRLTVVLGPVVDGIPGRPLATQRR
jgi:hypothetical protein